MASPEPFCAACCHVVDNLTGIRPHPAQDFRYCLRCWDEMSNADQGLVRIHLEMLTLLGAAVLERSPADWLVEADEATFHGLVLAPGVCKQIAAWISIWEGSASRSVRETMQKAIAQRQATEAAKVS